ncbi:MAG TPA: class I SAM-dependent methyltransferase [Rhizomicrobium sp.]
MSTLYDTIGKGYADYRKPDPRIAALIEAALGDAQTVINIGAGAGSYESRGRRITPIEPSATMIAQRPPGVAKAIQGYAEHLSFPDKSFDAATAFLTTHHWAGLEAGLREMKRVSRGPCVFFDHDGSTHDFWLIDYFPDARPHMRPLLAMETARAVFGELRIVPVPVPRDCTDGFLCAYWRRPERYLDPNVRAAISFFSLVDDPEPSLARLRSDLQDGTWARRYGGVLGETEMDFGYRLVIAQAGG